MKLATGIAVLTMAVAGAYGTSAQAVEESHANASGPTARCQSALPVFDTAIRKRPLAVQNEGSGTSFVTCSFEVDAGNAIGNAPLLLDTYFSSANGPQTITCTAVSGFQGGTNEFISQSIVIDPADPETPQGNGFWLDTDFEGGLGSGLISISCGLPPGVSVNDTYIYWAADDATDAPPA